MAEATMKSAVKLVSGQAHSQRVLVQARKKRSLEKFCITGLSNSRERQVRQFGCKPRTKQDSNARSPDIVLKGECSTPGKVNHRTRDRTEGGHSNRGRADDIIQHVKSIKSSSLQTQRMPEGVRHINAAQIMQQQVRIDNQPGHAPRRRHSQDTTQGCIPLEPKTRGTVAGLCSGKGTHGTIRGAR